MAKKETARQKQARLRREARARRTPAPKNTAPGTGRSRASRSRTVPSLMTPGKTYGNPGSSSSSTKKETPQERQRRLRGRSQTPTRSAPPRSRTENRRSSSNRTTPKTTPASKVPTKRGMSNIPPSEGQVNNPNYGKPGNPKSASKTTPKVTPKVTPKPAPADKKPAPKAKASGGKKLTPMQQWAKANPGLAKKVKKGQSGYKELKNGRSSKPRNWLAKNYKPKKK